MGFFDDMKFTDFLDPFGITHIARGVGAMNDALTPRETQSGGNQASRRQPVTKAGNQARAQEAKSATSSDSLSIESFVSGLLETGEQVGQAYLDEYLPGGDEPAATTETSTTTSTATTETSTTTSTEWTTQEYALAAGAVALAAALIWAVAK